MKHGLGDILVDEHLLSSEQLRQAKRAAERLGSPLVTVLLEQGLVTEENLVESLRRRLRLDLFDPLRTLVDADAVREVPYEEANRYRLLPVQILLREGQRVLRVAMADPLDAQAIEDIEFSTGSTVDPFIGRPSLIADAIRHHYRSIVTKIIPRGRTHEFNGGVGTTLPAHRRSFGSCIDDNNIDGNNNDEQRFQTNPILLVGKRSDPSVRVDALVGLLLRKGLITKEEYEAQLCMLMPKE